MKIQITQIKKKRASSGQIMTEACIGLSLLAFTWILISYTSFMGDNRIRTAMAARHFAWRFAKENNPSMDLQTFAQDVNDDFFYSSNANVQMGDPPIDHVGSTGITILNTILVLHNHISDNGPYRIRVSFGIEQTDLRSASLSFPFNLLNTQVPFMTNSMMAGFLSVNSQCQWAAIGDPWISQPSDPKDRQPLQLIEQVGNALNSIFNVWNEAYTHAKWILIDLPACLADCLAHPFRSCHCDEPAPADFGCHP